MTIEKWADSKYKKFYQDFAKVAEVYIDEVMAETLQDGEEGDDAYWEEFGDVMAFYLAEATNDVLRKVYNLDVIVRPE